MDEQVFAIVTGDVISGGPELMHQLVDVLSRAGGRAAMVYYPFGQQFEVPEPYRRYRVPVARWSDVPVGARVVVPETYSELLPELRDQQVYFWWLSVDVYFRSLVTGRIRHRLPAWLLPLARRVARWPGVAGLIGHASTAGATRRDDRRFDGVHRHLYQSEYARLFLEQRGWGPSTYLGDYINDAYLDDPGGCPDARREDLVVFNPAKGYEQTQAVLKALDADGGTPIGAVPIVGMSRAAVRDLLGRAKLYIDFGAHPGKDRIPREAATMGACVIVNQRGSAGNPIDVPLPGAYKVDDTRPGFEQEAARKVRAVIEDFGTHTQAFSAYRQRIAREKAEFSRDAQRLFLSR